MGIRELGWGIFLAGLPFAHLLFKPLDPWHGQALWAQGWALLLWLSTVGWHANRHPVNKPLALLMGWLSLRALYFWVAVINSRGIYPVTMLQGLMHLLILLFGYQALVSTWTEETIPRMLRWMAWSGVVLMAYCVIQLVNLDQFFMRTDHGATDALVGTIGNPNHLSAQLVMLLSLFLLQSGWFWWCMAGCAAGLVLYAGSAGGQVALGAVLLWWAMRQDKRFKRYLMIPLIGVLLLGLWMIHSSPQWFNPYGRFAAWKAFYALFQQQPITGLGPGFIAEYSRTIIGPDQPLWQWRHAHNEYFQVAIEYGLIGLFFVLWMIRDVILHIWKLPQTRLVTALAGVLLAFGINSLVNFPAHLWQVGSYALVAYGSVKVLSGVSA